jgi:hypothetical protein
MPGSLLTRSMCVAVVWGLLLSMQAVADEEGYISLINTRVPKNEAGSHIYSWLCHRNAIFDVAFSGECPLRVWPSDPSAIVVCGTDLVVT